MTNAFASLNVSIDRSKHTVLVVDDNPVTCYATARALRSAGFATIEAGTGQQALDLSRGNVSAVVLDVHLPDIGGFDVCRMIRAREVTTSLPIVHLSAAFIEETDKVAGLNAGADAYLTHPAEPAMLVATIQALVRARMAEERVHRSEAKFRSIYEQAQSGIALIDDGGLFVDANPAMLEMLARPAEQVIGHPVADFAAPGHGDRVRGAMVAAATSNALWREELVLLDGRGRALHVEWTMSANATGEARVAAVSNVSNRIQMEADRKLMLEREQAARANAERHSRTKDDFVAVLSHELRNPLSAIMLNLHHLLRQGPPAEYAARLQAIKRNAETQARIIRDILDVSRINSGKLNLEREWVDPAALIAASVDSMKASIDQKQLRLDVHLQTGAEQAFLDPARLQQIFWNILNNAVKFSKPNDPLAVDLSIDDGMLRLVVQDHGKGIEADFLKSIFEKFTQAASPGSRPAGGLGLGMSIVKHLVDLHGGSVEVASAGLGHGTTVTVTLPMQPGLQAGSQPGPQLEGVDPHSDHDELRGTRILVVEDDREASDILLLILRERGAEVEWAGDFDGAMKMLEQFDADVLVSDIGLPGRDGYELILAVRASESRAARIPAIALTAFGRPADKEFALGAGFDVHLAKPLQPQQLVNEIARLLGPEGRAAAPA